MYLLRPFVFYMLCRFFVFELFATFRIHSTVSNTWFKFQFSFIKAYLKLCNVQVIWASSRVSHFFNRKTINSMTFILHQTMLTPWSENSQQNWASHTLKDENFTIDQTLLKGLNFHVSVTNCFLKLMSQPWKQTSTSSHQVLFEEIHLRV